jgi:hypothetical protein
MSKIPLFPLCLAGGCLHPLAYLIITPFAIGQAKTLPGLTNSYTSTYFFACILFITLMMEAVSTSEMLVYFNKTTQRYIPEGCRLHVPIFFRSVPTMVSPSLWYA